MASKAFLDANILLDFLLTRNDYDDSEKIIQLILDKKIRAYVTPSIVHILGYWTSKAYGNVKAKELLITLLSDITVIDSTHQTVLLAAFKHR